VKNISLLRFANLNRTIWKIAARIRQNKANLADASKRRKLPRRTRKNIRYSDTILPQVGENIKRSPAAALQAAHPSVSLFAEIFFAGDSLAK
jgi:hypothetical protein